MSDFDVKKVRVTKFPFGFCEMMMLSIPTPTFDITLVVLYRPPSMSPANDPALINSLLSTLHSNNLIIVGDFNLSALTWPIKADYPVDGAFSEYVDFFINSNLEQLITEPTRYRAGQVPSLLDLVLTNDPDLFSKIELLPPIGKSDHVVISATIQVITRESPKHERIRYASLDYNRMNSFFLETDWSPLYDCDDVSNMWSFFHGTVKNAVTAANQPRRGCTNGGHRSVAGVGASWITAEIRKDIKTKRSLWQRFKRSNSPADYNLFRTFSNQLSANVRKAREVYQDGVLSRSTKSFYSHIRRTISSKVSVPLLRRSDGTVSEDYHENASIFSNQFKSVFNIPQTNNSQYTLPVHLMTSTTLSEIQITRSRVLRELKNLKPDSAPGPDEVHPLLLKNCAESLADPIVHLLRSSFMQGVLPSVWKTAWVVPIFKKGDKLNAVNYRPISLVSIVCKILERLVVAELVPYLLHNNIIPAEQHGFLPGRSVFTNLARCLDDWTKALDNGHPIDVVYFDFSKAFDKVPINYLLYKLNFYGISGNLRAWIAEFLTDRTFCVKVGNSFSDSQLVLSGVPQGTVLGPVLFLVFVADIGLGLQSRFEMYADDLKLYNYSHNSASLQRDIDTILTWSRKWSLPINEAKCAVLHLGYNNPQLPYHLNMLQISPVTKHSDLGVIITSDLSWSEQTISVVKKANSFLYLVRKAFPSPSPHILSKIFTTYIRPILESAGPIWSPWLTKDITLLESVQRRMSRSCPQLRHLPYEQRLDRMKLTPLKQRRSFADITICFKALSGLFSVDLSDLFVLSHNTALRGHSFKLARERFHRSCREHFISNRVFEAWNSLPQEVVSSPSVETFKHRLRAFLGQ